MPNSKINDRPLLHKQFPGVFPDEVETPVWYMVLPSDFVPFLMSRVTPATMAVILALRFACDRSDYTKATRTNRTLAKKSGLSNEKSLRRITGSEEFRQLVNVIPGKKRTAGQDGVANTYDLTPLYAAYREWRALQAEGSKVIALPVPARSESELANAREYERVNELCDEIERIRAKRNAGTWTNDDVDSLERAEAELDAMGFESVPERTAA